MVNVLGAKTTRALIVSSLNDFPISVWHVTPAPCCACFFQLWTYLVPPFGMRDPACLERGNNLLCRISTKLPLFNAALHWAGRGTWSLHFRPSWVSAMWVTHIILPSYLLQTGCWVSVYSALLSQLTTYPSAFLLPRLSWRFSSLLLPFWVYSFIPFGGFTDKLRSVIYLNFYCLTGSPDLLCRSFLS